MTKQLLFYLFLLCSTAKVIAQSGEIIYRVNPPETLEAYVDTTGFDPLAQKLTQHRYQTLKTTVPFLKFTLTFNKAEAVFKSVDQMANDNGINPERIAAWLTTNAVFYTNLKTQKTLDQYSVSKEVWRVQSALNAIDWKITTDTKTIKGYLCYKATAPYKLNGLKDITLEAWFCPQLPYAFGPLEARGLPGLVLALKRNNYYYYAEKIDFSEKSSPITPPKKGEKMSFQDYVIQKQKYFNARRSGVE